MAWEKVLRKNKLVLLAIFRILLFVESSFSTFSLNKLSIVWKECIFFLSFASQMQNWYIRTHMAIKKLCLCGSGNFPRKRRIFFSSSELKFISGKYFDKNRPCHSAEVAQVKKMWRMLSGSGFGVPLILQKVHVLFIPGTKWKTLAFVPRMLLKNL